MDHPGGRIIRIEDIGGAQHAEVEVSAAFACPRCAAGKGCGAGLWAAGQSRLLRASVGPGVDVEVGDSVCIELAPRDLLLAAWLVYGLPLATAVAGAALAYAAGSGDAAAALAAVAGLAAGVLHARRRVGTDACLRRFTPRIVAKRPVTG